jgi:hypothetical protein
VGHWVKVLEDDDLAKKVVHNHLLQLRKVSVGCLIYLVSTKLDSVIIKCVLIVHCDTSDCKKTVVMIKMCQGIDISCIIHVIETRTQIVQII